MDKAQAARRFKDFYIRALSDQNNGKSKPQSQRQSDYAEVDRFINDLTSAKDVPSLDACIEQYLKIYRSYSPDDRRSKMAFFHLLNSRIDLSAPEDKYLAKLSADLSSPQRPFTVIQERLDSLEDDQKRQISKLLKYKEGLKNQHATIFDELWEAYGSKKASTAQLYAFSPLQDAGLEKSLRSLMANCKQAWDKCEKELNQQNWEEFSKLFTAFTDFLKQNRTEKLKLFQILKWCRDPFIARTKTVGSGRTSRVETIKSITSPLEKEFYFQTVYAVLLRAVLVVNPAVYQHGFSKSEESFFLDPLSDSYYFSNYQNRLRQGISNAAGFPGTSLGFLWLLLFSSSKDLWLVNDAKFKEIANIYNQVIQASGKTPQRQPAGNPRTFSTRGKSTWDFAKDTFKVGSKQGAGQSETEIVYFEGENTRDPRIFLEFTQMRGPLFEVNLDQFLKRVEATPYQLIWEANKGLIRLIAEYFGFLFTMFFPGVGYFGVFMELGFVGVLRQVVEQEILDQVISRLSEHSASGGANLNWLSLIVSGKNIGSNLAKKLEREAMNEARADARLLEGKTTRLLGSGEDESSRLVGDDLKALNTADDRMLQNKPSSWKSLPVVGERQTAKVEATAAKGTSHDILDGKAVSTAMPTATRQDLTLAEQNLKDATKRFNEASETLNSAKQRAGDLEDLVKEAKDKPNSDRLKQALNDAEQKVEDARARYKSRKYDLKAAESKVERLTKDLAQKGELPKQARPVPRSYSDAELDEIVRTTSDIRRIRQLASNMNSGNAGSLFERWANRYVFLEKHGTRSRIFVKRSENVGLDLERDRSSDFFVDADGSIWDAKIYQHGEQIDAFQLDDYRKMEEAGSVITVDGAGKRVKRPVNSINYLFADESSAKINKSLIQVQGGGEVFFIDDKGMLQHLR